MTKTLLKDASVQIDDYFGFMIIDDLLTSTDRERLHAHVIQDSFFYENSFEWNRVWHPLSGMALLTGPRSYGATGKPGPRFPTDTAYDLFFEAVGHRLEIIGEFLRLGSEEVRYVMSAYLYRSGWGLPWHEDIGQESEYKGAFTYYLHDRWRGNWGGELMILADERVGQGSAGAIDLAFAQGTGLRSPSSVENGVGTFIFPKSNRLVVMRPKVLHSVNPVSDLAGENMRFSLAGFYL
ncbi:2OG-Fe(II) oxygenase [Sphingosinicellaceae bacterium]|nr:2OG-Fe(II) oxygenase [Sphingosinicellaceae bacterium]